ncbi:MAG TPA: transporter substrate-binding domain-containing protein [Actinomycetota bacterium]|nr:transporter substrate-binding domain-containing protein [Actinomycetota bacterium]
MTGERGNVTADQENRVTRRRLLRSGLGAAAVVAASPLLAACGSNDDNGSGLGAAGGETLERLRSQGAKLGLSAGLPTSGVEDGKAVGIFPEIAELVLRRLGVDEFIPVLTSFDGIIPGLQVGRVDLALPGLYITAERCKSILFSHPLIRYADALAVPKGNPDDIETFQDVVDSDLKVAAIAGSTGAEFLKQQGIPEGRQVIFPDLPSILEGMKAGRVDVTGSDAIALGYLVGHQYEEDLELIPLDTGVFSSGVGFAKDATDLQTAFNEELRRAQADDALAPVYEKWNVPKDSIEGVEKLTQEEECRKAV